MQPRHQFMAPDDLAKIVDRQRNAHRDPSDIIEELEEQGEHIWNETHEQLALPALPVFLKAFVAKKLR